MRPSFLLEQLNDYHRPVVGVIARNDRETRGDLMFHAQGRFKRLGRRCSMPRPRISFASSMNRRLPVSWPRWNTSRIRCVGAPGCPAQRSGVAYDSLGLVAHQVEIGRAELDPTTARPCAGSSWTKDTSLQAPPFLLHAPGSIQCRVQA